MRFTIPARTLCFAFLVPHTAFTATATQRLGTCLADSTTGKDRKELAR